MASSGFRDMAMASSRNGEPGSRGRVKGPADTFDFLGGGGTLASHTGGRRRAAPQGERPAAAMSNMSAILSELGEGGRRGSLTAPARNGQYSGGLDNVVLGEDNVVYDCGSKEGEMRLAQNAQLVAAALSSPVAGRRLPDRDRTGTRTTQVGGADSIMATISDGSHATFRESIQEAQRQAALDPAARQAASAVPVAGGGSTGAAGERGLRVTRPVGGSTTHSLDWLTPPDASADGALTGHERLRRLQALRHGRSVGSGEVAPASLPSSASYFSAEPAAAAGPSSSSSSSSVRTAIRPRDSLPGLMADGSGGSGGENVPGHRMGRRPAPEHAVGGYSAPYLDNSAAAADRAHASAARAAVSAALPRPGGDGSGTNSMRNVLAHGAGGPAARAQQQEEQQPPSRPSSAYSRLHRQQPVGGRTALEGQGSAAVPEAAPLAHAHRGDRSAQGHMASSLVLG